MGEGFQSSHLMTIGADFAQTKIMIDKDNAVTLQIWDVAGQEEFKTVRSRFLHHANICLMVFYLTRRDTFHSITKWMQDFWDVNPTGEIPLLIIGNKADLEDQIKITDTEMDQMVAMMKEMEHSTSTHVSYISTSAATGLNISDAFNRVAHQIIEIYLRTYK